MGIAVRSFFRFLCRSSRGILLLAGFVFSAAMNIAAQDERAQPGESAMIYHLAGKDFTLTLHGEQTVISREMVGSGIDLERTGTVHTGPGTFLEIQLIPSGTVIKLSENTSLIYNGFDENGKFTDLGLLYGRVLAVTGNTEFSAGVRSLVIRSGGITTRIEDADVGVDYFLESGNTSLRPLNRVYVFRGRAEIFPYGRSGTSAYFGGAPSLALDVRECLSLDISPSYTFSEKTAISRDIVNYWGVHYIAGSPPQPLPDTVIAADIPEFSSVSEQVLVQPPATVISYTPIDPVDQKRPASINRSKNICLATGLVLTAGALGAQGFFHYKYSDHAEQKYRNLFDFTYPVLAAGLITTLVGIVYNPPSSRK